jgi:hypothetical protein
MKKKRQRKDKQTIAALAQGIAAIAASKLLKDQLNGKYKFADGGLVLGPTKGQVGEMGPEIKIPTNRKNNFLNDTEDDKGD